MSKEIASAVAERAFPRQPKSGSPWDKNQDYVAYGLYDAELREVVGAFRPRLRALTLPEVLGLAGRLFRSGIGELASVGVSVLAMHRRDLGPAQLADFDRFLEDFHSWSTTDGFAVEVLGPLLMTYPRQTLGLLRQWTRSPNRWKRRAGVVAFTRRVGASGRFTADGLRLCANLIWDSDDLVQKGVGWALKDLMRGDRTPVYSYVRRLRQMGVPSTITLYAMRDLRGAERRRLLAIVSPRRRKAVKIASR